MRKIFVVAALLLAASSSASAQSLFSPGYRCDPGASQPASWPGGSNTVGLWCPSSGPNAYKLLLHEGGADQVLGASGYSTIQDNSGTPLTLRSALKFMNGLNASDGGTESDAFIDHSFSNTWLVEQQIQVAAIGAPSVAPVAGLTLQNTTGGDQNSPSLFLHGRSAGDHVSTDLALYYDANVNGLEIDTDYGGSWTKLLTLDRNSVLSVAEVVAQFVSSGDSAPGSSSAGSTLELDAQPGDPTFGGGAILIRGGVGGSNITTAGDGGQVEIDGGPGGTGPGGDGGSVSINGGVSGGGNNGDVMIGSSNTNNLYLSAISQVHLGQKLTTAMGTQGNWTIGGQLASGNDSSHNTFFMYTPVEAAASPFLWSYTDAFHSQARYDQVMTFGPNLAPGGTRYRTGSERGAMGLSMEDYFEGGHHQMEGHWMYVDPTDVQHRPITMLANLTAPYDINLMVGAESFTLSGYDPAIGGPGGTVSLDSTQVIARSPNNNNYIQTTNASVLLSVTGTGSGTLTMDPALGDTTAVSSHALYGKVGAGQAQLQITTGLSQLQDSTGAAILACTSANAVVDAPTAVQLGQSATTVYVGGSGSNVYAANGYHAAPGKGLDANSAGNLPVGTSNATSISIGGSSTTLVTITAGAHTLTFDNAGLLKVDGTTVTVP